MDQEEHEHQGQAFEGNGPNRNIAVLLQAPIEPLHAEEVEDNPHPINQEEGLIFRKPWHQSNTDQIESQGS